jgi:uncharacterized protein YdhG (YjbR/CyaY superfamily)
MKKSTGKKSKVPATPDAYLAGVEEGARATLEKLRKTIKSAVPKATEVISYGIPTFKLDGKMLASYAAFKDHCSFFPGAVISEFEVDLKSYETAKGTIRFPTNKPLPAPLVKRIVKARIARIKKKS